MSTTVDAAAALPRLSRAEAIDIARAEGEAVAALLSEITAGEWELPTDCPEWTVRDMAAHLVAQGEDIAHPSTALRRKLTAPRRFPGRTGLDAHTALQVAEHAGGTGPQLAADFARQWPKAVAAMRRTPALVRRIKLPPGVPAVPALAIGYLHDCIYPRDLWMHRVDITRATGRDMRYGRHDAAIVAQVVRDLAQQWQAATLLLELTGPAGGRWLLGSGAPTGHVRADTAGYLRCLAGRDSHPPLDVVLGDSTTVSTTLTTGRVLF